MAENEKELSLLDYLEMLRRHKWILIAAFVVTVGLGVLYTFRATPVYRSTAVILIERETARVIEEGSEVVTLGSQQAYGDYYNTQLEILKSRDIRERAGKKLGGRPVSGSMLRVEPVRNSWLVKLSVDHPDPAEAALIVNTVAEVFVDENLARKIRAVSEAQEWLFQQSQAAEIELQLAEKALDQYRRESGEISLDEAQDITVTRMRQLNAAYTQAQDARITAEARYRKFRDNHDEEGGLLADAVENPLIQGLKRDLIEMENRHRNLSERFMPTHHEMVRLSAQIEDIEEKISAEKASLVNSLTRQYRREYEAALKRENDLKALLDEQEQRAMELSRSAVDFNILRRSVDTKQGLHQMLLTRAQEAGLAGELPENNISILDRGEESKNPVSPNPPRNILASALIGLILGAGLVFFTEYAHDTVNSTEDIEGSLPGGRIKLLSTIPHIKDSDSAAAVRKEDKILFQCSACGQKFSVENKYEGSKHDCTACRETMTVPAPGNRKIHPHIHSAFGLLRTNLLYPPPEKPMQNVLVTSPVKNDGKTFVSLNLANAFADIGKRTLIVGADLRKPGIDKLFDLGNVKGLAQYLVEDADIEEIIHELPVENLYAVPCGRTPDSPELLLSSPKMQEFSELMKQRFDYIVYDSPPVAPVADAILLSSSIADRTILIARAERTPMRIFRQAFQMLEEAREGIVAGTVLNDISHTSSYHYYRYYKYYRDYESESAKA